jgi:triphosphoribosyl-dephospho-CoA synthase
VNDDALTLSQQLAQAYKAACLAEVEALKPGNVHIFADGHDMQVQDFIESAEASTPVISQSELALGERIFHSVAATWDAVGCNTNLGIILLCAPIIQAALLGARPVTNFRHQLIQVLTNTTRADAEYLFKAIRMANPAGLGCAKTHDVHKPAECTLLEAMQASYDRDFIGQQYANGFSHVFEEGLPHFEAALLRWGRPAGAATALYLYWLSHYPDSHIVRKYGMSAAIVIQDEARTHHEAFQALGNPKHYLPQLLAFDQSLKSRAINPGTSADLTVATLLVHNCCNL